MSNLSTVKHMKTWSRDEVKTFLQRNKIELNLEDKDIKILYNQRRWGIPSKPAKEIDKLIKEIKGELLVATASHQPAFMRTFTNFFGQMNVSDNLDNMGTSASLPDFLKVIKDSSKITKDNLKIMKDNLKIIKKSLETLIDNSEIMKKSLETLIRLEKDRNSRFIPGQYLHKTVYQSIVFERVDQEYFLSKTASYLGEFSRNGMVNTYLRNNPTPTTTEDDILDWFINLMKKLPNWSKNLVVKDTHTNPYFCGLKPDLSIFIEEDVIHDVYIPIFVQTLLELKKRKSLSGFSDEEKCQLVNYIHVLVQQQPLRELFAIFLSDGYQFYVMAFDRNSKKYKEFITNFKTGLRLFWVLLNVNSPFTMMSGPKSIRFYTSNTESTRIHLREYLGMGTTSTVYKVDWQYNPSALKVYKDGYNPSNEASALRFLNGKVQNIPSLNVFHRDVCPSNILLNTSNNSLVLADWGSAIRPLNKLELVPYEGTITFASPNILDNNMGPYQPKASDDLHSFIRTMYILRNPSNMPTIPSGDLASKAQAIKEYWNDSVDVKLDGLLWTEMVNGANNEDYQILEKCCYIFKS
ncbi:hypothetical protein Glove_153g36 [Diversispora epigaea]|uniref:Protein kinase domain-containing protein n=1 Tax=Diversispora epigaea TaxID=1348612 RepID=A0A397IYV6_9GLOM|nr:hypothetical protein Glove_153g36 [Diversispora epigaea]